MSWASSISIEKNGHTVTGRRFTRGRNPIGRGSDLVGYQLTCTCGWARKCNEPKQPSESHAREHLRYDHVEPVRVEWIVCHARGYPDPYAPFPENTREAADQFVKLHGGKIRWRYVSDWQDVKS